MADWRRLSGVNLRRDGDLLHRVYSALTRLKNLKPGDLTFLQRLPLLKYNPERDGGESEAAVSKERPDAYPEDGGEAAR